MNPSTFQPAPRRLVASFPARLCAGARTDRNAEQRRVQELLLTLRDGVHLLGSGGGVAGGFAGRGLRWASSFDPTKLAGCVLDLDPSNTATVTTAAASLSNGSDFSNASWTKTNVTIATNDTTDPDGTSLADRVTVSTATTPSVQQALTNASSGANKVPCAYTFYVKRNDVNWVYLETRTGTATAADRTWFDIQNGITGTTGSNHASVSIASVGSGWYRIRLTSNATGSGAPELQLFLVTGDNVTTSASVGQYLWLYGASVDESRYSAIMNRASSTSWSNGTASSQPGVSTINALSAFSAYGAQQIISSEAAVANAVTGTDPLYGLFYVCTLPNDATNRSVFGAGNSGVASNQTQTWGQGVSGTSRYRTNRIDNSASSNTAVSAGAVDASPHVNEWYRVTTTVSFQKDGGAADPSGSSNSNAGSTTINQTAILVRPDSTPDTFHVGKLGRLALYSRTLSSAERSYIRVGLGNQWAIAVTP